MYIIINSDPKASYYSAVYPVPAFHVESAVQFTEKQEAEAVAKLLNEDCEFAGSHWHVFDMRLPEWNRFAKAERLWKRPFMS